jgi:hypothetical protein
MSPLHQVPEFLAAVRSTAAPAGPSYGTGGITKWLQDNVVTLLVVLIGVVLLMAAHKANVSKVILTVGLGLVGLFWLGLAASGNTGEVGMFLVNLVKKS